MYKYILLVIAFINISYSQEVLKVETYESNENKTGQVLDVTAEEHIRLFYTPSGNNFSYQYLANNPYYMHGRLGKFNYPTTNLTTLTTGQREIIADRPNTFLSVGSIEGNVGVNNSGGASYSIPIRIVPGTNNCTPNISLQYNSNSGNGVAGWGWNLSGISLISRIGKDKFHDDLFDKIQFTNLDKLVIDGNRLVLVDGTEGNSNAVYATEVGNSSRIYPHNVSSQGYSWFEVKNIDGSIVEYGKTFASKLETEKGIMSWFVNKITDENGNYILYEYGSNSGESFIKSISYTGNADAGMAPYAKVEFIYEMRNDNNVAYYDGIEFNQTVILKEILVKYNNQTIYKYVLDYIDDVGYSQLYRVIEYGENNERYNSTIFEYYAKNSTDKVSALTLTNQYIPELDEVLEDDIAEFFGDFNGDKITDRILVKTVDRANSQNKAHWYMQFGKYFSDTEAGSIIPNSGFIRQNSYSFITPPGGNYQFETEGISTVANRLLLNQVQIVDINGDGYDDVITPWLEGHFYDFGDGYDPPDAERYFYLLNFPSCFNASQNNEIKQQSISAHILSSLHP